MNSFIRQRAFYRYLSDVFSFVHLTVLVSHITLGVYVYLVHCSIIEKSLKMNLVEVYRG